MNDRVAVIGAGSWGTALAKHLADQGFPTRLWSRDPAHAEEIQARRENQRYLPGITLPDTLTASGLFGAPGFWYAIVRSLPPS